MRSYVLTEVSSLPYMCHMVEEPEITYTGSINNAETICTVRPLQETMFSKAGDCLRGHRVAADADNDGGVSISRLMAQSHGLRRALTPGRIRCLFCDR